MMQEKYPRVGVGGFIIDSENNILLQLRNKPPEAGYWSIPGGKVEFMEKLEDAITRELKEELGINVRIEDMLCVTNHIVPTDNAHWVAPTFLVEIIRGEIRNLEPDAIRQVQWFPLNNLPDNLTITTCSAIEAYFKKFGVVLAK
ncbi:NUDIX domain-containing protein [Nostoc sp. UIC 10607]|uniref:NUDIX domain-containing protein n=1 Tax=Nostoc sp. UIC 10607 TaxID=3045935 RepID=UPI00399FA334